MVLIFLSDTLGSKFDMRHVIHSLSFGVPVEDIKNPLDETAMGLVDSVRTSNFFLCFPVFADAR